MTLTLGHHSTEITTTIIDDNVYESFYEYHKIWVELPEQPLSTMITLPNNAAQGTFIINDNESWF